MWIEICIFPQGLHISRSHWHMLMIFSLSSIGNYDIYVFCIHNSYNSMMNTYIYAQILFLQALTCYSPYIIMYCIHIYLYAYCYNLLIVFDSCPVGWGCRIHRLHFCRGGKIPPNECPGYDTKQSNGEVPVRLEVWGMRSTPLLPLLPGSLWPGVVAPDKGLIYGLNRTNSILLLNWIVWINWIAWNRNIFHN